jgi:hypothetical protein
MGHWNMSLTILLSKKAITNPKGLAGVVSHLISVPYELSIRFKVQPFLSVNNF